MSRASAATADTYELGGIGIRVDAPDHVRQALKLRLRTFSSEAADAHVTFSFVEGEPLERPEGDGRPIYETPFGSVEYFSDGDELWAELRSVQMRCAPTRGTAVLSAPRLHGQELYLATHPLATLCLMEFAKRRARYALHAGCLASSAGDGALIAGPSGAGKSTLSIALAQLGLLFLSDDIVFLDVMAGGDVEAIGFPDALGVTAQTAARFPELAGLLDEDAASGFPKRLVRAEEVWPKTAPKRSTPRAIVFPDIVRDEPSALIELDAGDAMLRLVPDVLLTQPAATQAHLEALSALLDQVGCYRVKSGPDHEATARLVAGLL